MDTVIDMIDYLKTKPKNKSVYTKCSLKYLINGNLSQSIYIKVGIAMEKIITEIIQQKSQLKNIKEKNSLNKKETDILFLCNETKSIYYIESKANINLDTEKTRSTVKKIQEITIQLHIKYPEYNIKSYLLNLRYLEKKDIPIQLLKKYSNINVVGLNDLFNEMDISYIILNYDEYKTYLNKIVDKLVVLDN